jgi:hypothetical protein
MCNDRIVPTLLLIVATIAALIHGGGHAAGALVAAQEPKPDPAPIAAEATAALPAADAAPAEEKLLTQEQLEQLLAPIALYPDSLLTQILMASTYPLEIVMADRWVKEHKDLKGDALAKALEEQPWDPSVKSLINVPDQLALMSEKLDMTTKLGDAFIAQQTDVLNTIQVLRDRASKEGQLKSSEQMTVTSEPASVDSAFPAGTTTIVQAPPQVITIESSDPEVVYVPTYETTVVYGSWPYPSYPPYSYYPPGYLATAAVSFGVGVACGAAWGYAWGDCDWGGGDVDIDVNRNTNFNTNIDRSAYQANIDARKANVQGGDGRSASGSGNRSSWQHDPSHRQGVPYRDQKSAQKFGGADQQRAAQSRDQFRGRAESGSLESPGGRDGGRDGSRDGAGGGSRDAGNRDAGNRQGSGTRDHGSDRGHGADKGGAFKDSNRSEGDTRQASDRGKSSRSGSASHSSGGGSRSSGGGRSGGGGGSRGGGGGGRGGGRR